MPLDLAANGTDWMIVDILENVVLWVVAPAVIVILRRMRVIRRQRDELLKQIRRM